jgi:hypothetical protein
MALPLSINTSTNKFLYPTIHRWLRIQFGHPDKCENPNCNGKSKNIQYALKKGCLHELKRQNYLTLCVSCHRIYDFINDPDGSHRAAKPVIKIDPTSNKIIDKYISLTEACNKNKYKISTISMCLTKKLKTAYGYKWEYSSKAS